MGDGCLMEGISHEVCSLAGTLGLGKLIAFYDDNGISIDGEVRGWFTDDTPKRFEAYGWHVIPDVDGHDAEAVRRAIDAALAETARPSLICCKTIIGWGAPNKQGTEATHGAALGEDEVAAARKRARLAVSAVRGSRGHPQGLGRTRVAGRKAEAAWTALLRGVRRGTPRPRRASSSGGSAASCRAAGAQRWTSSSRAPSQSRPTSRRAAPRSRCSTRSRR